MFYRHELNKHSAATIFVLNILNYAAAHSKKQFSLSERPLKQFFLIIDAASTLHFWWPVPSPKYQQQWSSKTFFISCDSRCHLTSVPVCTVRWPLCCSSPRHNWGFVQLNRWSLLLLRQTSGYEGQLTTSCSEAVKHIPSSVTAGAV